MTFNPAQDFDYLFKFVIVGDSGVGKSNIILRFTDDNFSFSYQPTIGVDFKIKTFTVDNSVIKLQLWDTAGQERFKNIANTYYKGAHAIMLVFDITNRSSFSAVEKWMDEVEKYSDCLLARILIGNKYDLKENRKVSVEEGIALAQKLGLQYMETSAKDAYNIVAVFETLVKIGIEAVNSKKMKGSRVENRFSDAKREMEKITLEPRGEIATGKKCC